MSDSDVREVFQRYIDALNDHDFDRMTEFIHDELVENGRPVRRDDVIAELKGHGDAVPDFTWRVQDIAIDGDRVAARLFNKGTPAKEWLGVTPTGGHGRVRRVRLSQGPRRALLRDELLDRRPGSAATADLLTSRSRGS